MAEQQIPVEQVGAHGEGNDIAVDVTGSDLEDPNEPVFMFHPELDETTQAPRHAFDALWSKRGWVEYNGDDPTALAELRAGTVGQDGAPPPEDDEAPPDEEHPADPENKDGTPPDGAAPAANKK